MDWRGDRRRSSWLKANTKLSLLHALEMLPLGPALACQSFPQTMVAMRSGRCWAVVPELAVRDPPNGVVHHVSDRLLQQLDREATLAWNPRVVRVRPNAAKQQQLVAI